MRTVLHESRGPESDAVLGVILLDYEGYSAREQHFSPTDEVGLGALPPGFLENPSSWSCRTIYRVASGCTWPAIQDESPRAAEGLREAAEALDGRVDLITADCAYTWFNQEAFDGINTPILISGLALVDLARAIGKKVAILALSRKALLSLMGDPPPGVRIIGLDAQPTWVRYQHYTPLEADPLLDPGQMAKEILAALDEDFQKHGEPDVIVLECTGLPQFRKAIRRRFRGCLLDIASFVQYTLDVHPREDRQVQLEDHVSDGRSDG